MKAAHLLFLAINCAALMCGTGYAAPSGAVSQQQSSQSASKTAYNDQQNGEQAAPADGGKDQRDGKPSGELGESRHVSDNHARKPARLVRANRLGQLPNNHHRSASPDAANFRQPDSDVSGSIHNEIANNALHVRPRSGVVRPGVSSLNNARHRGPNPAAINGSANLDRKNTATIDGTRMTRKP